MSNVNGLQIETNGTDANTTDVCVGVFVTKDVSFDSAKQEESWSDNSEVRDEGQKCISTKETLTGSLQRAQLVAGGFEE